MHSLPSYPPCARIHEERSADIADLAAQLKLDAAAAALKPYHQQSLSAAEATANAEAKLHEALSSVLDLGAGSPAESQDQDGEDEASAELLAAAQAPGVALDTVMQLAEHAKASATSAVQMAAVIEAALPDEQELEATRTELGRLRTALESESALQPRRVERHPGAQGRAPRAPGRMRDRGRAAGLPAGTPRGGRHGQRTPRPSGGARQGRTCPAQGPLGIQRRQDQHTEPA